MLRGFPIFANQRLQGMRIHLAQNLKDLSGNDPTKQRDAITRIESESFAVLPQTLFVLVPLFAVLLKVVYLFRRRLYMEHLTVALHSHAFLFLCLLLGVSLHLFSGWLSPHAVWVAAPMRWLQIALAIWAPSYLLLMQKRVYRQGWLMTVLKYLFLGWCYLWLLGWALGAALLLGMAW